MLAVCRGVQGVGGGGIMQLVQISISDIVPLAERPKYMGALGSLWGISSVLGPLIGMCAICSVECIGRADLHPTRYDQVACSLIMSLGAGEGRLLRSLHTHMHLTDCPAGFSSSISQREGSLCFYYVS